MDILLERRFVALLNEDSRTSQIIRMMPKAFIVLT